MDISCEDAALDKLWRERFQQPMPMRGAADIVKRILVENGVDRRRIDAVLQKTDR